VAVDAFADARAEIVVKKNGEVDGLGIYGLGGAGEVSNRERSGGTIEETAEVWLKKV
jgi:hypothetical protein